MQMCRSESYFERTLEGTINIASGHRFDTPLPKLILPDVFKTSLGTSILHAH